MEFTQGTIFFLQKTPPSKLKVEVWGKNPDDVKWNIIIFSEISEIPEFQIYFAVYPFSQYQSNKNVFFHFLETRGVFLSHSWDGSRLQIDELVRNIF